MYELTSNRIEVVTQSKHFSSENSYRAVRDISHIPKFFNVTFPLRLSYGLVFPQFSEELRFRLAAVWKSGSSSRCSCNQVRIQCFTIKQNVNRL